MFADNIVVIKVVLSLIFGVIYAKDLYQSCSQSSECIPISDCQPDHDRHQYVKSFQCGRNETEMFVCCDDYRANIDLPDKRNCGDPYMGERIIGGVEAGLDEYPWIAILEYERTSKTNITVECAGSLINDRYILTAAHCLNGNTIDNCGQLTQVRLGEYNLDNTIDCIRNDCADPVVTISVEESIPHPDYNATTKVNDVGLIRLSEHVKYTDFVRPICLPSTVDMVSSPENTSLEVTGWGRTGNSKRAKQSQTKQKLSVPVFNHTACARQVDTFDLPLTESQLCAGGHYLQDACHGDSGGSLMKLNNGRYAVEGIVSYGLVCGRRDYPGIYTRVSSFESWIKANIRP